MKLAVIDWQAPPVELVNVRFLTSLYEPGLSSGWHLSISKEPSSLKSCASAQPQRERYCPEGEHNWKKGCWCFHEILPYRALLDEPFWLCIFGAIEAKIKLGSRVNTFLTRF